MRLGWAGIDLESWSFLMSFFCLKVKKPMNVLLPVGNFWMVWRFSWIQVIQEIWKEMGFWLTQICHMALTPAVFAGIFTLRIPSKTLFPVNVRSCIPISPSWKDHIRVPLNHISVVPCFFMEQIEDFLPEKSQYFGYDLRSVEMW